MSGANSLGGKGYGADDSLHEYHVAQASVRQPAEIESARDQFGKVVVRISDQGSESVAAIPGATLRNRTGNCVHERFRIGAPHSRMESQNWKLTVSRLICPEN